MMAFKDVVHNWNLMPGHFEIGLIIDVMLKKFITRPGLYFYRLHFVYGVL